MTGEAGFADPAPRGHPPVDFVGLPDPNAPSTEYVRGKRLFITRPSVGIT